MEVPFTVEIEPVFRKTRQRERAEVERAQRAAEVCGSEHGPAVDVYTRDI